MLTFIGNMLGAIGVIFWAGAVYVMTQAIRFETSVPTRPEFPQGPQVANLSLMQIQMIGVHVAIGCTIVGTILICTSAIMARMRYLPPSQYDVI